MVADTAQSLRSYLLASSSVKAFVGNRVHQNNVVTPKDKTVDWLWYRQGGKQYEHTFDDAAGTAPRSILFDVECCSRTPDKAADLADAVRGLFPYAGTMGDATIKAAFVNDQNEDYEALNEMASDGVYVQALQIEICP